MNAKERREAEFLDLFNKAHEAGMIAGKGHKPIPMVVGTETVLFSGVIDPTKPIYHESEGVCGFAWIVVKPGNSSFAKWLKATKRANNHYYGGMCIWVSEFNQAMERKEAYAHAFTKVLVDVGINAYAGSRMD